MSRIVLLRHGRTAFNAERRIQGQLDTELDDTGLAQAAAVARHVAEYRPALLWCSDLSRAAVTAAHIGRACGLEPVPDPRLREFHLGERQGLRHTEYAARFPEEHAAYVAGRYDVAAGAEARAQVADRMVAALTELFAATPTDGVGVAVGHGAAIRVAVAALLGWPEAAYRTLAALANCHWAVLERDAPDGQVRLAAYNLGGHVVVDGPGQHPDFASPEGVG